MEKDHKNLCSESATKSLNDFFALLHYKNEVDRFARKYEVELPAYMDVIEKLHCKVKSLELEKSGATDFITQLEGNIESLNNRIKTLEAQLKDARSQVATQLTENTALKADLTDLEQKFQLVQQVIKEQASNLATTKQLAFLNGPAITRTHSRRVARPSYVGSDSEEANDSQMDYDLTEESLEEAAAHTRSGRVYRSSVGLNRERRSQSAHLPVNGAKRSHSRVFANIAEEHQDEEPMPSKRSNRLDCQEARTPAQITTTTTIQVDPEGRKPSTARVTIRRSMNRSMSESNLLAERERDTAAARSKFMTPGGTTSQVDLRSPAARVVTESWTQGNPIDTRRHRFEKQTVWMSSCDVCNRSVYGPKPVHKCMDCLQVAHIDCGSRMALPCVPRTPGNAMKTPSKGRGIGGLWLQDFCPKSHPMIPYPLIHCIVALEKGRLSTEGIYRVPGLKSQATTLLNQLLTSRAVPKMELQDTEVITDCIKTFLRELKDPLIPKTSRAEFIKAVTTGDERALHNVILELPEPNRDTLAYMCIHWRRVADSSEVNKMPIENIARCVAPTIVGPGSMNNKTDMATAAKETELQKEVMSALLNCSTDYWNQFLSWSREEPGPGTTRGRKHFRMPIPSPLTKDSPQMMDRSILGPISNTPAAHHPSSRARRGRLFEEPRC